MSRFSQKPLEYSPSAHLPLSWDGVNSQWYKEIRSRGARLGGDILLRYQGPLSAQLTLFFSSRYALRFCLAP